MSTQHPDNANTPFFSDRPIIAGETEITEAYYAFSHLDCKEQLWDCEGKESDSYVVKKAFDALNDSKPGKPFPVDEQTCITLGDKTAAQYMKEIELIAPVVNQLSVYIPRRRKRKLHIGLFGYSRKAGSVSLPRAITFCAALYSVGFPPELMGISALNEKELELAKNNYRNFEIDLGEAARYYNPECIAMLPREVIKNAESILSRIPHERDEQHSQITSEIIELIRHHRFSEIPPLVVQAARLRGFLG